MKITDNFREYTQTLFYFSRAMNENFSFFNSSWLFFLTLFWGFVFVLVLRFFWWDAPQNVHIYLKIARENCALYHRVLHLPQVLRLFTKLLVISQKRFKNEHAIATSRSIMYNINGDIWIFYSYNIFISVLNSSLILINIVKFYSYTHVIYILLYPFYLEVCFMM